jgi:hypothetical protein
MGQQQLLLLVLGAIIVGMAIVVGINMFNQNALTSSVDATKQDCLNIAARAQEWVRKPSVLGGPSTRNDFSQLDFSDIGYTTSTSTSYGNENADFSMTPTGTDVTIDATTKEKDNNNQSRKVTCVVSSFKIDTMYVTVVAASS